MVYKYYAVKRGRVLGIFSNWWDCKKSVWGCSPRAWYKGFNSLREAEWWLAAPDSDSSSNSGYESYESYY